MRSYLLWTTRICSVVMSHFSGQWAQFKCLLGMVKNSAQHQMWNYFVNIACVCSTVRVLM